MSEMMVIFMALILYSGYLQEVPTGSVLCTVKAGLFGSFPTLGLLLICFLLLFLS